MGDRRYASHACIVCSPARVQTLRDSLHYSGRVMRKSCDLCGDSGTLRDGSPCPGCSMSWWKELGSAEEIVRPKRTVWIRANGQDIPRGPAIIVRTLRQYK